MRTTRFLSTLTLVVVAAFGSSAAAQTFDPGTGRPATQAPTLAERLAPQFVCRSKIGYTTNSVVTHYRTLDAFGFATGYADLVAQGHTLIPVDALTPATLAGLDELVVGVVDPATSLSPEQVDVIEAFVRSGKRLVFLGENNNYFRANNVAVGGRFGITYPTLDPLETVLTAVPTHPILLGPYGAVTTVDGSNNSPTYYGSMSSPGPWGSSILNFPNGYSACVVIEPGALAPGSGLVVAVAELNIWDEGQIGVASNRALWNNIFAYCPAVTPARTSSWARLKALYR